MKKFKRFGLEDYFTAGGKRIPAYSEDRNGALRRNFQKTTKKWRKEHGV